VAATVNVTDPLPVPAAPPVMESHAALLVATHVQPVPAATEMLPVPPAAAKDCEAGEMPGAQGAEYPNVFDTRLGLLPPGPTADTLVS
jgi:hypothetical protein